MADRLSSFLSFARYIPASPPDVSGPKSNGRKNRSSYWLMWHLDKGIVFNKKKTLNHMFMTFIHNSTYLDLLTSLILIMLDSLVPYRIAILCSCLIILLSTREAAPLVRFLISSSTAFISTNFIHSYHPVPNSTRPSQFTEQSRLKCKVLHDNSESKKSSKSKIGKVNRAQQAVISRTVRVLIIFGMLRCSWNIISTSLYCTSIYLGVQAIRIMSQHISYNRLSTIPSSPARNLLLSHP